MEERDERQPDPPAAVGVARDERDDDDVDEQVRHQPSDSGEERGTRPSEEEHPEHGPGDASSYHESAMVQRIVKAVQARLEGLWCRGGGEGGRREHARSRARERERERERERGTRE